MQGISSCPSELASDHLENSHIFNRLRGNSLNRRTGNVLGQIREIKTNNLADQGNWTLHYDARPPRQIHQLRFTTAPTIRRTSGHPSSSGAHAERRSVRRRSSA